MVQIITLLQARAPKLTLLVTSQHVLKGPVQEIYWLRGLSVPASPGTGDRGTIR